MPPAGCVLNRVPRALLLDLDGTVADSLGAMRLAYHAFLRRFGRRSSDAEFDALNGPPLPVVVERLKANHALEDEAALLLSAYARLVDDVYADVAFRAGADDLLRAARGRECTVGIVTSGSAERAATWLEHVGLAGLVDFIVSDRDVSRGKPDPEPYLVAVARAGCAGAEAVAVEDSPLGAAAARAAGLRTFVISEAPGGGRWPDGVEPVRTFAELSRRLWGDSG